MSAVARRAALLCLPFAVFGVGLALPLPSQAQVTVDPDPGGFHPLPAPLVPGLGWVARARSDMDNPQPGGDYDWTGLTAQLTLTPYSGPVFTYPADPNTLYYGGGGAGSGNQPMEATHSYLGTGGGSGDTQAHYSLPTSGSTKSTYFWQWDPPNNAVGQPDLTNFPVPPLFVLGKGYGVLSSTLGTSPNQLRVSVSGSVSSGIGSASALTINSAVDAFPIFKSRTDYAVLTPSADSPLIYKQELSPSASYLATGAAPNDPTVYPATPGQSRNWVGVRNDLYPITLSAPNPLTNPLLGDGTNQYVYDAEQPDGYLAVPASSNAVGASTPDTAWLLSHVGLFVSPGMQTGVQPFQWQNYGSQMYVYTPGTYPNEYSYPSASFIYKGLPPNNSYFGNHVMTMKVDNQQSQIADYQLFFNARASNWPGAAAYQSNHSAVPMPNWYYYYNQAYTSSGSYAPGKPSQTISIYPYPITLRDDAYDATGYYALRVYTKSAGVAKWIGLLIIPTGIMQYIHVVEHERGHQIAWQRGGIYTTNPFYSSEDGVIDTWEDNHALSRDSKDSTGSSDYNYDGTMNNNEPGDDELIADIQVLPVLFSQLNAWQQDWADGGIQNGNLNIKPDFVSTVTSSGTLLNYRLWFTPVSVNNATHAYSYGTSHWVSSVNEIATLTGYIPVTGLSDLGP